MCFRFSDTKTAVSRVAASRVALSFRAEACALRVSGFARHKTIHSAKFLLRKNDLLIDIYRYSIVTTTSLHAVLVHINVPLDTLRVWVLSVNVTAALPFTSPINSLSTPYFDFGQAQDLTTQ